MRRFAREESGQMLILVAAMMLALIMFVGLAIDAGRLYGVRRTMQEAADAGAYAGAVVLYQKGTQAQAFAAARDDAKLNGYEHLVNGASVVVRQPLSSPFNNALYVEVIIETTVRTALMPQVPALTTVRVSGVGGAEPLNNQYAIMALDRGNTPNAFQIGPTGDVHLSGGGILVNSTSATAGTNQQNDTCRLTITPSPHNIDIAGNTGTSWPTAGCPALGTPAYTVDRAQPQQADPFAEFPKPLLTGCDPLLPTAPCQVHTEPIPGSTRSPGIYPDSLSAGGGTTLYLRPGTYILKKGMNGAGNADFISMRPDTTPACATDCGVFIFNTHTNYDGAFRGGATCGGLSLVGNAASDLRARTTGDYANFLFYQDSACTNEMVIAGNGTFNGTGTVYLPSAHFRFNGNPSTLNGSQLVAKTVDLQNGNITINFDAGTSAQPILPRLAR